MRPRKESEYQISKNDLQYWYYDQYQTRQQIATRFGVSESLVKYYMNHYGMVARSRHSYKRSQSAIDATAISCWQGYGEISKTYFNQIRSHRNRRGRNLPFSISIEDIWTLFLKQNRRCAISNLEIHFAPIGDVGRRSSKQTASLDRIDSSVGYVLTNVQWVHKDIQKMKMDFAEDRFYILCQHVCKYQENKQ